LPICSIPAERNAQRRRVRSAPGESEVPLGEFQVEFSGRDRAQVRRKALDYWYHNREYLKLDLKDFLTRCKLSPDERTIIFVAAPRTA
jgi:hypothetical protein